MESINQEYIQYIKNHRSEVEAALQKMTEDLYESPMYCNGRLLAKPLAIQKVYTADDEAVFREVVTTMHRICCKVIGRYLEDSAYRKLFPFSSELEELILLDPGYEQPLPMARFDIFYDESTRNFMFCEINTDGTSAMNEDAYWVENMGKNPAHQFIENKYALQPRELFDSWVHAFLRLYADYAEGREPQSVARRESQKPSSCALSQESQTSSAHKNNSRLPHVAIVDFLEVGAVTEFQKFAEYFQKAGCRCTICDVRTLRYDGEHLLTESGAPIDAVYRRAVTGDVMSHYDEIQPFLQAYRDGAFFMAGSFRTQVVHNKALFTVLHRPETKEFLTAEENEFIVAHVPVTQEFGPEGIPLDWVLSHKDKYILKPLDSYAAAGVVDGLSHNQEEWTALCQEHYGKGYVCQEYHHPHRTPNIDFTFGDGKFHDYINMSGLYAYDGVYQGVYSRLSPDTLIVSHHNERSVGTFFLDQ